jgi:hypothetical protein
MWWLTHSHRTQSVFHLTCLPTMPIEQLMFNTQTSRGYMEATAKSILDPWHTVLSTSHSFEQLNPLIVSFIHSFIHSIHIWFALNFFIGIYYLFKGFSLWCFHTCIWCTLIRFTPSVTHPCSPPPFLKQFQHILLSIFIQGINYFNHITSPFPISLSPHPPPGRVQLPALHILLIIIL